MTEGMSPRSAMAARVERMEGQMTGATRLAAIVCLMLAMSVTRAHSETDTSSAHALMPGCRNFLAPPKAEDLMAILIRGVCIGEVQGVWDTAVALVGVCSPPQVTSGEAVRVVVQYIDARPARMHEPFDLLALEALTAAWPCRKK